MSEQANQGSGCIIHLVLNIALYMVVSLCLGGKSHFFKGLKEPCKFGCVHQNRAQESAGLPFSFGAATENRLARRTAPARLNGASLTWPWLLLPHAWWTLGLFCNLVGRWLWVKTRETPGEHQNRWQMEVHPPKNGAIGYAPWPNLQNSKPFEFSAQLFLSVHVPSFARPPLAP